MQPYCGPAETNAQGKNSDVLLFGCVVVAVMTVFGGSAVLKVAVNPV